MHSCWGIFCFVLTSFGLNLVVLEFLFENDFEIEKKERKRKKKKQNNASPSLGFGLATQSLARPSSHSLPHSAHSLSRPNRARLPFSVAGSWAPPVSASLPSSWTRAEQETFSGRTNPETPGFLSQGGKPSPTKSLSRSRGLLLHPNRNKTKP